MLARVRSNGLYARYDSGKDDIPVDKFRETYDISSFFSLLFSTDMARYQWRRRTGLPGI